MEAQYAGKRIGIDNIMEWDVVNWGRALPFWINNTKLDANETKSLELGARDGGLSLWLSSQFKKHTYSDIYDPTPKCLNLHKQYEVSNIKYIKIDGSKPFNTDANLIVTKSVLGSSDRNIQDNLIANIYNALRLMENIGSLKI